MSQITTKPKTNWSKKLKNGNKKYPGANHVNRTIIDKHGNETKKIFHLKYRETPIKIDHITRHDVETAKRIFLSNSLMGLQQAVYT